MPQWADYKLEYGIIFIKIRNEGHNIGQYQIQIKDKYKYICQEYNVKICYPEIENYPIFIEQFV